MSEKPTAPDYDWGRVEYLSIADELSADPRFLEGADVDSIGRAMEFAHHLGLVFPPYPDVDVALAVVRAAEANIRGEE